MLAFVIVLVSLLGAGQVGADSTRSPLAEPTQQAVVRLGDLVQQFALNLSLVSWNEPRNAVLSPFSITSLLSQLLLGTSGSTYNQLRSALLYPDSVSEADVHNEYRKATGELIQRKPGIIVNVANRLFLNDAISILPSFNQNNQHYYGASVQGIDFGNPQTARDIINSWVSEQTQGKIPRLLTSVHPQTSALAVNTVYFKGDWKTSFQKMNTSPRPFNTGKRNITVPMMSTSMKVFYVNMPEVNAQMIGLPYIGDRFAMYIIMPNGPVTRDTLLALELSLNARILNHYISTMSHIEVNVFLPKMKVNFKTDLADTLKQMGVTSLFDPVSVDFSRMTTGHVFVDKVIHETVIEVTETGTEAAAASASTVVRFGTSREFLVNRPFLMLIRDQPTGLPLFWGRVIEPQPLLDEKP